RAHDDECSRPEVRLVELEDTEHLGQLRVQVLVKWRARHEYDRVGCAGRRRAGDGLQAPVEGPAELLVAALLLEGEASDVHLVHGDLVDVDETRRGARERQLHPERQPDVTAATDDCDGASLEAVGVVHGVPFLSARRASASGPNTSSVLKNAARLLQSHDTRQRGVKDAGKRSRAGWDVQLRLDGGADSRGSSVARGEADGGRSASRPLEKVRVALLHHGSPLDSAGAALAGAAAAGALLGPQRAAAGGAARVQPAFSLVRGTHDG